MSYNINRCTAPGCQRDAEALDNYGRRLCIPCTVKEVSTLMPPEWDPASGGYYAIFCRQMIHGGTLTPFLAPLLAFVVIDQDNQVIMIKLSPSRLEGYKVIGKIKVGQNLMVGSSREGKMQVNILGCMATLQEKTRIDFGTVELIIELEYDPLDS